MNPSSITDLNGKWAWPLCKAPEPRPILTGLRKNSSLIPTCASWGGVDVGVDGAVHNGAFALV